MKNDTWPEGAAPFLLLKPEPEPHLIVYIFVILLYISHRKGVEVGAASKFYPELRL
jgi:hypothetical protein